MATKTHPARDIDSALASIGLSLATRKSEVLASMANVKETWAERAAIREYLGGMPRERAEREAVIDTARMLGFQK